MTVNNDKLLRMAEQITANLNYTDDDEVVADKVAVHLGKFWDPRMLGALEQYRKDNPQSLSRPLDKALQKIFLD